MNEVALNILTSATTYKVGDFLSGKVVIDAPVIYQIKSLRLELVCSMVAYGKKTKRTFLLSVDDQPVRPEKYACSMPFTSGQALYHNTGTFGKTSIEWSLEAKAVVVCLGRMPDGSGNHDPQVLEASLTFVVTRGDAALSLTITGIDGDWNPDYILVPVALLLLFLSMSLGAKVLVFAGMLYGLFYLERELTRKHLFRGLAVSLKTNEAGRPEFWFVSALEADDFKQGEVGLSLKERFRNSYVDVSGNEQSDPLERGLLKHSRCLKEASRWGRAVVCELPVSTNELPTTLDFNEDHGYTWSATYVYPRKYWMDVRVDWDLKAGLLPGKTGEIG